MATINDMALECLQDIGQSTGDSFRVSQTERWVNEVCRDVANRHEWPFERATISGTLIAGTELYTFPKEIQQTLYGRCVTTGNVIVKTTLQQLVNAGLDMSTTGEASHYYINGASPTSTDFIEVGFFPIPSDALTYEFGVAERWVTLTTGQDISQDGKLPEDFYVAIKAGVLERLYLDQRDPQGAADQRNKFEMYLKERAANWLNMPDDTFRIGYKNVPSRDYRKLRFPGDHYNNG